MAIRTLLTLLLVLAGCVADARIIASGDRERSVLWLRIDSPGEERMPPLASHVVDATGSSVVGDWIDSL